MAKITDEAGEDIILWRNLGKSWGEISTLLLNQYEIEISRQAVSDYFKRTMANKTIPTISDKYKEIKGEDQINSDIESIVDKSDRLMNICEKMIDQLEVIPENDLLFYDKILKSVTQSFIAIAKFKTELMGESKNKEDNPSSLF